ncbi:MAG: Crp/Fnr family transcriptional regulator [Bacteroidales bacterium]
MEYSHEEILRSYFKEFFPSSRDGLDEFISAFSIKGYGKGEMLLSPNHNDSRLRFLTSGYVREFYSVDGKEVNVNFFTKPEFITDICSFNSSYSSHKWQEALSEVELVVMDRSRYQELLKKYPCGKEFFESLFQRMMQQREEIEFNRLTKSPEELYRCILDNSREWLLHIPLYHIALFIGVTPETLSRIRRRIY